MNLRLGLSAAMALLVGCQTMQAYEQVQAVPREQLDAFLADKPAPARRLYARVPLEGKRNETLNQMRAGLAAMELGDTINAARSFDVALNQIEAVYADNETAAQARSLWTKENFKDFKGEPYERGMPYYYRGLLYMMEGDYQNARASFKGGVLQTAFSNNERYDADFALLTFLEGWAARCANAGNVASDAFSAAAKSNPALVEPPNNHSVLVLAEFGSAPAKVAGGGNREYLSFQHGEEARAQGLSLLPGGPETAVQQGVDLYHQAVVRGGRQIDGILAGKAQFKDTTNIVATGATYAGLAVMANARNRDDYNAGALIALAGILGQAAAAAMRPDADLRAWDNIPGTIHLATLDLKDMTDRRQLESKVLGAGGEELRRTSLEVRTQGGCSLVWFRDKSALQVPDSAPGAVVMR